MIHEQEPAAEPAGLLAWIRDALRRKWTRLLCRALAVALAGGALMHLASIAGLSGRPWLETPLSWRLLDVVLLVFDVAVAIGLWRHRVWAVIAFVIGILALQILPFTLFPAEFTTTPEEQGVLRNLVASWLFLIALLLGLIGYRK